jgi:hypothetical protein
MEMDLRVKLECKKNSKVWLGKIMVMVNKITLSIGEVKFPMHELATHVLYA